MKRIGLWCLCAATLLSVAACGSDTAYNAGMTALQNQNYAKAYDLFLGSEDPCAAEMLEKFVFVPVEERRFWHNGGEDPVVTKYTYNDKGWPIKYETTEKGVVSSCEFIYDQKGNLLISESDDGEVIQYTYDDVGNKLSSISYGSDGKEKSRKESRYDDRQNCIEHKTTDASGTMVFQYEYDDADHNTRMKNIATNGDWIEFTFEYDAQGNVVKTRQENSDGTWNESTVQYDDKGNKIRACNKNSEGSNHESWYEYDGAGRCVKETHPSGTIEYTYDEAGRKLSEKDLFDTREEYIYNQQGRLVKIKTIQPGGSESSVEYTYDEAGRPTSRIAVSDMSKQEFFCTYDQYGNLLSRRNPTETNVYEYAYQWTVYYYPDGLNEMTKTLAEDTEKLKIKVEE